jgi:chorismate synthase
MSIFGKNYRISTFGESHCEAVGVIIDGVPSKFELNIDLIQKQLDRRRPGQSEITTPRDEKDKVEILSGMEHGKTLGTPICAIVKNKNIKKGDYGFLDYNNYIPRPSHADYTYMVKYGIHASSGGGRSSARETIGRVIGGTIADLYLKKEYNIDIVAFVSQIGGIKLDINEYLLNTITRDEVDKNIVRCPNNILANKMIDLVKQVKIEGDSIGGMVTCVCRNVPSGLGNPCFDKLEALLAHAMLSLPATKGFEIGSGFNCIEMRGSEHNDYFIKKGDKIGTATNNSGGIQGGISNGENIYFNIAFKPASSISLPQNSVDLNGNYKKLEVKGRHDPCFVYRAVPIVEAMTSCVLMDMLYI